MGELTQTVSIHIYINLRIKLYYPTAMLEAKALL